MKLSVFRNRLVLTAAVAFAAALAARTGASAPASCTEQMRALAKDMAALPPEYKVPAIPFKTPTLEFVFMPGANEAATQPYLLRRKADWTGTTSWSSLYSEGVNAPQGDPRWFTTSMGEKTGSAFGFELKTVKIKGPKPGAESTELLASLPGVERYNQTVNRVNAYLPAGQKIEVGFYKTSRFSPQSTPEKVLRRFAEDGHLPCAEGQYTMIHDMNYHGLTLLYPPEVVDLARRQAKATVDFADFMIAEMPLRHRGNARAIRKALLSDMTSELDLGTGNLAPLISKGLVKRVYTEPYVNLTGQGASPASRLWNKISERVQGMNFGSNESRKKFADALSTLYNEFEAAQFKADPRFRQRLDWNADQLGQAILDRKAAIEKAVIAAGPPP